MEFESKYLQYMAAAAGNLNIVASGAILGWTSPILPKLEQHNPIAADNHLGRPITKDEGSWLGSLASLGVLFGSLISGYLSERFGRRRTLLMTTFSFILGWILVTSAKHIEQMYVGRLLLGVNVAIPFTIVPLYSGEISDASFHHYMINEQTSDKNCSAFSENAELSNSLISITMSAILILSRSLFKASIRGTLGSFLQIFVTLGFLFTYSVGPYASYVTYCSLCACISVISFIVLWPMPESPYFLISKGRNAEAARALARFRGKSVDEVQEEMESIQEEIAEAYRNKTSWKNLFADRVNRKAVLLMCATMCFLEFTGVDVVLFYAENIFIEAGAENTSVSTIILGVVQLAASIISPIIVDRSGRKLLLIVSSVGIIVSLTILGTVSYMRKTDPASVAEYKWVPLAALIVYISFLSFGWSSVPWTIIGEIFSPGVSSKASSACVFCISACGFLLTKVCPNIEEASGAYTNFWLFSVSCVVNIIFVITLLPETKGKTLNEIQLEMRSSVGGKSAGTVRDGFSLGNKGKAVQSESTYI